MSELLLETTALLAALGLGLSAGALFAEGAVLVPFWRSLEPQEFFAWYRANASRLLRFFGPLELVPAVLAVLAAVGVLIVGHPGAAAWIVAALGALGVLASFPLYFRSANEGFAGGTLAAEELGAELRRWSRWHWGRTLVAIAAFLAALLALGSHS